MKTAVQPLFEATASELIALGDRLRLARLRRRMGVDALAAAAGISRGTLFRIEQGAPSVAIGAWARVLEALDLAGDLAAVADTDDQGRRMQDGILAKRRSLPRKKGAERRPAIRESAQKLWAFKRENQRRDVEAVEAGRATGASMSWFSPERASSAVVLGEPL